MCGTGSSVTLITVVLNAVWLPALWMGSVSDWWLYLSEGVPLKAVRKRLHLLGCGLGILQHRCHLLCNSCAMYFGVLACRDCWAGCSSSRHPFNCAACVLTVLVIIESCEREATESRPQLHPVAT